MPTHTPRPRSGDDAERGVALRDIPLLDAEGIEIPLVGARVEQIAVNEAPRGASEAVIPASCPRHPQLSTALVRQLSDGQKLGCHAPCGCVLTLPAGPLFDVLGDRLG